MRFLYGVIAFVLASLIMTKMRESGCVISDDAVLISMSIITAGAIAGGD